MTTIKIKRSAVPAKVPTTSDIDLAELAINTYDGKIYLKKDNGTQSIVLINAGGTVTSVAASSSDITITGSPITSSGTLGLTLATVNSNVGSFGSSTSIPSFTVNAKGLITAASGNVVIAPAGTLTGTTLNSTVVTSSLTSVGTITVGTWNASAITSNYLSYNQGSTGAQPRLVLSRLQDFINFNDFTPAGDGTTNDRSKLVDALAAAAGRTLRLQKGTYLIGSNLTLSGCDMHFDEGAILKPGVGVTISLGMTITAGLYQIFDVTASGAAIVPITAGPTTVYPQWWGASVSDTTGSTNRAAINACHAYGKDVTYTNLFTVNDTVFWTGGTRIRSTRHRRGGAGLNFKVTSSSNMSLVSPLDTVGDLDCDHMTFQIDATSAFTGSPTIKIVNLNGGRWIQFENNFIQGIADTSSAFFIGLEFSPDTTADPSFNQDICGNVINNCDTDIKLNGDSGDVLTEVIGVNINDNQCLSASADITAANIDLLNAVSVQIGNNVFNAGGESAGVGAHTISIRGTSRYVNISSNYYDSGTNGKRRITLSDTANHVAIYETMISNVEVYNTSSGTYTFNGVTSVSVVSANGFAGTVATATTTPAITLSTTITGILKGNGTAISAATAGTDYLTVLTGDVTTSSNTATLATVNSNVGSFGSSTSIPTFTVNGKGLITAASGNAVIAPAGTLTGSTLSSGVTASSLTSFGSSIALGTPGSGVLTNCTGLPLTSGVTGTLPVANGGTNSASYTAGSVIFAGASGTSLTQDNSKLFWDDTNFRLGLGITSPVATLDVVGTSKVNGSQVLTYTGASGASVTSSSLDLLVTNTTPVAYTGSAALATNGIVSSPMITNDGTGGTTNRTQVIGLQSFPQVVSTGTGALVTTQGAIIVATRGYAADTSTNASNAVTGITLTASHAATLPSTAVSSSVACILANANVLAGNVTTVESIRAAINIAGTTGTTVGTITDAYGFHSTATLGNGTGTAHTITNYYGLRLDTPTIGVSATITNRYGIYQADTAATNFFGSQVVIGTAGQGLSIKEGSNAKMGTATMVAGTVVVSTTAVTANSRIFLTVQSLGTVTVPQAVAVTARTAGTSFTITSSTLTDTSVVAWMLVEGV